MASKKMQRRCQRGCRELRRENRKASESEAELRSPEPAVVDVETILVALRVFFTDEVEAFEDSTACDLDANMTQVEADPGRHALFVVEEPIILVTAVGQRVVLVVPVVSQPDPERSKDHVRRPGTHPSP